ncbi:MAG: transposase [Cytophagaceae bacterium]|nr:MAG: transposase [Cytophagaceae bacterium]
MTFKTCGKRPRFGYRRVHAVLRHQGTMAGIKQVYKLYRHEGLAVRRRRPKRVRNGQRQPLSRAGLAREM